MVSRWKGLALRGWKVCEVVWRRMGWWLEKVLGRWQTWESLNKSFHWELARALSKRFMTRPLSLLLVHVNLGPLYPRSMRLQLLRKLLNMVIRLRFGGELLKLSWCVRVSLKSLASNQWRVLEEAKEVKSFQRLKRVFWCHAPNPKGSKAWEKHFKGTCRFFFFWQFNPNDSYQILTARIIMIISLTIFPK